MKATLEKITTVKDGLGDVVERVVSVRLDDGRVIRKGFDPSTTRADMKAAMIDHLRAEVRITEEEAVGEELTV